MGVDAGADSGAAEAEFAQAFGLLGNVGAGFANGDGVGGKFLAETNRDRILQMRAAGLENAVELFGFLFERAGKRIQHGVQVFERQQSPQAHSGRENIVGGLAVVHVVVGMDVRVLPKRAAEQLIGSIGDHLVGIHVEADAGSGLKHVNENCFVPLAIDDFLRSFRDGLGTTRFDEAAAFGWFQR